MTVVLTCLPQYVLTALCFVLLSSVPLLYWEMEIDGVCPLNLNTVSHIFFAWKPSQLYLSPLPDNLLFCASFFTAVISLLLLLQKAKYNLAFLHVATNKLFDRVSNYGGTHPRMWPSGLSLFIVYSVINICV